MTNFSASAKSEQNLRHGRGGHYSRAKGTSGHRASVLRQHFYLLGADTLEQEGVMTSTPQPVVAKLISEFGNGLG